ncbi:MAG: hypothetical protein N2654_00625 [Deltaproteobacteria bacterium]|nr:hypothetical protein [Deltaproteobacteria bacterium]
MLVGILGEINEKIKQKSSDDASQNCLDVRVAKQVLLGLMAIDPRALFSFCYVSNLDHAATEILCHCSEAHQLEIFKQS